jgi:hypothetical protein
VRRAREETWPAPWVRWEGLDLVCRPNLDLWWGLAGRYGRRYGNLRRDDARTVIQAALADGGGPEDALWFRLDPIPEVRELAEHYGDPQGNRVHFWAESVRRRWLDLAQGATGTTRKPAH